MIMYQVIYLCFVLGSGVGVKRRLEEARLANAAEGGHVHDASEPVASSSVSRGGVRSRLESTTEHVSSSVSKHDAPYTDYLRQQWGKGKLSSAQVQEHAFKAAQQGAAGLESLSAAGEYNLSYNVVNHKNKQMSDITCLCCPVFVGGWGGGTYTCGSVN